MKKLILLLAIGFLLPIIANAQAGDTLWHVLTKAPIIGVKFSPDDKYVYALTETGVEKHDAKTGALLYEFKGYFKSELNKKNVSKFSGNCTRIITKSKDSVAIWDIPTGQPIWKRSKDSILPGFSPSEIDISADGRLAFFASDSPTFTPNLIFYDYSKNKIENKLTENPSIQYLSVSSGGIGMAINYFNTLSGTGAISLWAADFAEKIKLIDTGVTNKKEEISKSVYSPDGSLLYYNLNPVNASSKNYGTIWKNCPQSDSTDRGFSIKNIQVNAFSRDNKFTLGHCFVEKYDTVNSETNVYPCVQIASASNGKIRKLYYGLGGNFIDVSHDNKMMVLDGDTAFSNKLVMLTPGFDKISVYDKKQFAGDTIWAVSSGSGISQVHFSSDEKFCYSLNPNSYLAKYNAETGEPLRKFVEFKDNIAAIFSEKSPLVVIQTKDSIFVWNEATEHIQSSIFNKVPIGANSYLLISDISPDEKYIYCYKTSISDTNNFVVLNLNGMNVEKTLSLSGQILKFCASPDGKYLAAMTINLKDSSTSIKLLNAASFEELVEIQNTKGLSDYYTPIKFSYDSKKLAFSFDKKYTVYNIEAKITEQIEANAEIGGFCFSRDGKSFIFKDGNDNYSHTKIWSFEKGRVVKEYSKLKGRSFDISKDDQKLLVGTYTPSGKSAPAEWVLLMKTDLEPVSSVPEFEVIAAAPSPFKFLASSSNLEIIPDDSCQLSGIEIANAAGKIVMSQGMDGGQFSIDISALASGAYYCRIKCGEKVYTEAFAVTR